MDKFSQVYVSHNNLRDRNFKDHADYHAHNNCRTIFDVKEGKKKRISFNMYSLSQKNSHKKSSINNNCRTEK